MTLNDLWARFEIQGHWFLKCRKMAKYSLVVTVSLSVNHTLQWRLDYCNSMFVELPDSTLAPLQRVLHAAARFVGGLQPRDHVTATLIALHWLPVRQRITYKLCCLMHGVVYGHTPRYLSDMVVPVSHLPGRAHLRSAQRGHFDVLRSRTVFGSRSFSVAAPQAWNELPADIRHINTFLTFKRHL